MNTQRLFFALWPDNRQRDRMRDVINSVAKTVEGKPVERRNWHITLAFVGEFPENRVLYLQEQAAEIQMEPFRLNFDKLEYWPRPKIASLSAATVPVEMRALVDSLQGILSDLGIPPEDRTYRPHITVSRDARPFTVERLAQRTVFEWSRFELMQSVPVPGGVHYVPLKQ